MWRASWCSLVGVPVTHGQNLMLNLVLLVIQIARHLFWRRLFTVVRGKSRTRTASSPEASEHKSARALTVGCISGVFGRHDQDGTWRVARHLLGDTALQSPLQPASSMTAHDDKICTPLYGCTHDFSGRRTRLNEIKRGGRQR
jgi:hypothetical protein